MYPVIFVLSTTGLGRHTRRASALVVMGVSGGAVFPPMQGAISDAFNTRVSFFLVVPLFIYIAGWAVYIWNKDGRKFGVDKEPEAQIENANDGTLPYRGAVENYEGSIKEDMERVEKA